MIIIQCLIGMVIGIIITSVVLALKEKARSKVKEDPPVKLITEFHLRYSVKVKEKTIDSVKEVTDLCRREAIVKAKNHAEALGILRQNLMKEYSIDIVVW